MFVLNVKQFGDNGFANAQQFVEYWDQCYNRLYPSKVKVYNNNEKILYIHELNLDNDLTTENFKRLLRWKDPHRLTEVILSGPNKGQPNERVNRALNEINRINQFRRHQINEDQFWKAVQNVFPNGFVWGVFLFHIARPQEFPIADQNVFLAFAKIRGNHVGTWEQYINWYKPFFFEVAEAAHIDRQNVEDLKRADNALFAFGKFLKTYGG